MTYAKGKLEQFEAQYAKISAAHEEHTVEKLKALLKEASDVIQEQMTIIRTFTEADNCNVPLSFLGDNGFLFALSVSRRWHGHRGEGGFHCKGVGCLLKTI